MAPSGVAAPGTAPRIAGQSIGARSASGPAGDASRRAPALAAGTTNARMAPSGVAAPGTAPRIAGQSIGARSASGPAGDASRRAPATAAGTTNAATSRIPG